MILAISAKRLFIPLLFVKQSIFGCIYHEQLDNAFNSFSSQYHCGPKNLSKTHTKHKLLTNTLQTVKNTESKYNGQQVSE